FEPLSGRRRVISIFEVTGLEGDVIAGNDLWAFDAGQDALVWTGIPPRCLGKVRARGIPYVLPNLSRAPGNLSRDGAILSRDFVHLSRDGDGFDSPEGNGG